MVSEAGGQGVRKRLLRDFISGLPASDGRVVDLWADGLLIRRGLPLVVDVTARSVLTGLGEPRPSARRGAAGSTFLPAQKDKLRVYPEFAPGGAARDRVEFVVAACELGGRWNEAARSLVHDLCAARASLEPPCFRVATHAALATRWWGFLSCAVQRAYASSVEPKTARPSGWAAGEWLGGLLLGPRFANSGLLD